MMKEIVESIILAVIGFSGGITVSAGTFALITVLDIIPRLTARLQIADQIYHVETISVLGGTAGCILTVFAPHIPVGWFGLGVFGIFAGIFTGTLTMALAETLKVIPIVCQRIVLQKGIAVVITMIALGKGLGCLYQMLF